MIIQHSAARSTSSRKQHKIICQLRTNTTAFFSSWPRQTTETATERQGHHSNNKAPLPHHQYFSIESSRGEKNHPPRRYRDECVPLVSCVDTVYCYNYDLRVAPLNNRNDLPPCFSNRKIIPCFLVHPPHPCYKSDKSVCAIECVCSYSYLYYLHEY